MRRRKQFHERERLLDQRPNEQSKSVERRGWGKVLSVYAHTVFWCLASAVVWIYGDMQRVLMEDPRLNRLALGLAVICLAGAISTVLYMACYVSWGMPHEQVNFEVQCPRAVYCGMVFGLCAYVGFIVALWPIWSWTTIMIVSVFGVASILAPNFLPSFLF